MSFVYPAFLYALIALAIPIIIHLFNFRRFKKVYFTNVRFLQEVKQETKSRSRLKHLLVLALRLLALAFLVLAFAQPFVPVDNSDLQAGSQTVSIYIDNSFSMDAVSENGRLLDLARNYARDIADNYQATDKFQLLTNDFEGRHQQLVNKDALLELIDEIEVSPAVRTTGEVLLRQRDALSASQTGLKSAYVISDFQATTTRFNDLAPDSSVAVNFIPIAAEEQRNIYIDSCWFSTPVRQLNQNDKLNVRIRNSSDAPYENVALKLLINGQQKALASFSLEPNSYVDTALYFTTGQAGTQHAVAEIRDYPITYDDRFYFSFEVAQSIPVLCIFGADSNRYVQRLLGNDPFFELSQAPETGLNYSELRNQKLIILSGLDAVSSGLTQELGTFVSNGGHLLVIPSAEAELESYREFLLTFGANTFTALDTAATKVAALNLEHELFRNVFEAVPENMDMPAVLRHYPTTTRTNTNQEPVLTLQNGSVLLSSYNWQRGKVYVLATDMAEEAGKLPRHALFVPMLYNIGLNSSPSQEVYYTLGEDEVVEVPTPTSAAENVYHLGKTDTDFDIVQEPRIVNNRATLQLHGSVREAGNYEVTSGQQPIAGLAFNYSRSESDLAALTPEQLLAEAQQAGLTNATVLDAANPAFASTLTELREGKKYWKLCLILALLLLGAEALILRFWK